MSSLVLCIENAYTDFRFVVSIKVLSGGKIPSGRIRGSGGLTTSNSKKVSTAGGCKALRYATVFFNLGLTQ